MTRVCPRLLASGFLIFTAADAVYLYDRFGHPAGDALLVRLSHRLRAALGGDGVAYRMGGDEFCALLSLGGASLDALVARALAALSEQGEGFAIDAAHGTVRLPHDEAVAEAALRLADQRMYAHKQASRVPTERQTTDVLLALVAERNPKLGDHADGVAELAVATGRALGLRADELDELALAARLHDVGKAAVPDSVLAKSGPLDPEEWAIIRRHPAVGERILRAAPALAGVARMVRASHERVDGAGYPDGLAGDDIPLGARVVAVCDAFDAIGPLPTHLRPARLIHTVGHSTRERAELVALLREAGVDALADVRRYPGSRRHPHFAAAALAASLPDDGIAYLHLPELGGRRSRRPDSPNGGWENAAFQGYADHMDTPEFAAGLARLEALAAERTAAVMCAEAQWWRCHRVPRRYAAVMADELWVCHLGEVEYRAGVELQATLRERVAAGGLPDALLLLEHPAVYTLGRRSAPEDLPMGEDACRERGIDVVHSDRGGKLTYHGPGQLVGYPIMRIDDVHAYLRTMEDAIVDALGGAGIVAGPREGLTGVWVRDRKIASIGVHVSRRVTTHGFAVNVDNDLAPFDWVVPCGLPGARMTSVAVEAPDGDRLPCFRKRMADRFCAAHGRRQRLVTPQRLGAATPVAA